MAIHGRFTVEHDIATASWLIHARQQPTFGDALQSSNDQTHTELTPEEQAKRRAAAEQDTDSR